MKFRKKPVVIEAMQLRGPEDEVSIALWAHDNLPPRANAIISRDLAGIKVRTLEGDMLACYGDWIIKGVKGEFYPCKPDIFEATYEKIEANSFLKFRDQINELAAKFNLNDDRDEVELFANALTLCEKMFKEIKKTNQERTCE